MCRSSRAGIIPRVADRNRLYRSEAVILRRQDLGEADRLLTLFTPTKGRVRAVAKGIRRPGSKKAGHLEPFTRSRLQLARGRELDIVTQAETISGYPGLRSELIRLGQAAYAAELLDRFGVEESDNQAIYQLMTDTLERLDQDPLPENALRYFQIRLLDLVGYRPELQRCVGCGEPLKPVDQFFSAMEGGVLCPNCGPANHQARPLSLPALKVLRHYQRSPYPEASRLELSPPVAQELEATIESYLSYLLERELKAASFVRRVRRLGVGRLEPHPSS